MDAVKRGDMETAQKMVREAAAKAMPNTKVVDKEGLPLVVYHGTNSFGFTVVDTNKSDDGISFFTTDKLDTARTYSGILGFRGIGDDIYDVEEEAVRDAEQRIGDSASSVFYKIGERYPFRIDDIISAVMCKRRPA